MILYDQNIWGNYSEKHTVGNRAILVADLIAEIEPDICAFQECNPSTMGSNNIGVRRLLGDDFDEICADKAGVNFTPLFVRRGKFNVIDEGYVPFEGLNDIDSKSFTYAVLETTSDKKRFAVISTHFWWKWDDESKLQRIKNAKAVSAAAERLISKYGVSVIVTGDLNSGAGGVLQGSGGYDAMLAEGFSDVRTLCGQTTDTHTCRSGYPTRTADDTYIDGIEPQFTIDYILTKGDRFTCKSFDVLTSQSALNSSDHCPLIFDFDIN